MTYCQVISRVHKVIKSCVSMEQLIIAKEYCYKLYRKYPYGDVWAEIFNTGRTQRHLIVEAQLSTPWVCDSEYNVTNLGGKEGE